MVVLPSHHDRYLKQLGIRTGRVADRVGVVVRGKVSDIVVIVQPQVIRGGVVC